MIIDWTDKSCEACGEEASEFICGSNIEDGHYFCDECLVTVLRGKEDE